MNYEIKNNKPQVSVPAEAVKEKTEEAAPNYAAIIMQDAMEAFAAHGQRVHYVEIAPFVYPDLAQALGQDISFPVLYGVMALDVYGLPAYVRMSPNEGGWHEAYWYELHLQDHQEENHRPLDTLIHRIVSTWESCQTQCERGFDCPLQAEIGIDLDGEVLQVCTALRDIESVMGGNLQALDDAATKFQYDNIHGVSEDKSEQEEKEDETGSSVGFNEGLGSDEHSSEDEVGRNDGDSL